MDLDSSPPPNHPLPAIPTEAPLPKKQYQIPRRPVASQIFQSPPQSPRSPPQSPSYYQTHSSSQSPTSYQSRIPRPVSSRVRPLPTERSQSWIELQEEPPRSPLYQQTDGQPYQPSNPPALLYSNPRVVSPSFWQSPMESPLPPIQPHYENFPEVPNQGRNFSNPLQRAFNSEPLYPEQYHIQYPQEPFQQQQHQQQRTETSQPRPQPHPQYSYPPPSSSFQSPRSPPPLPPQPQPQFSPQPQPQFHNPRTPPLPPVQPPQPQFPLGGTDTTASSTPSPSHTPPPNLTPQERVEYWENERRERRIAKGLDPDNPKLKLGEDGSKRDGDEDKGAWGSCILGLFACCQ